MSDDPRTGVDPNETEAQARARRTREAYSTLDDDDGSDARLPPYPVPGLGGALDMLRAVPADHVRGIAELRAVAAGESWQALDSIGRAACSAWMRTKLRSPKDQHWQVAVGQILGSVDRVGRWQDAPEAARPVEAGDLQDGAAWVRDRLRPPCGELVPDAPGLAYSGFLSIAHAVRGVGKTLYAVWLAYCALRAGLTVVVMADDDQSTWATVLHQLRAPLARFVPVPADYANGGALEALADAHSPDLIIIDSWRRWATAAGAARRAGGLNDEATAGPVADRLANIASAGPAVVLLANTGKDPEATTVRGSLAVEDSATGAVRSIERSGNVTTIRQPAGGKTRYGVPSGPFAMRFDAGRFEPCDPPPAPTGSEDDEPAVSTDAVADLLTGDPLTVNGIARSIFDTNRPNEAQRRAVSEACRLGTDAGRFEASDIVVNGRKRTGYASVNGASAATAEQPQRLLRMLPEQPQREQRARSALLAADAPLPDDQPQPPAADAAVAPTRPAMDDVPDHLPLVVGDTIKLSDGRLVPVLSMEDWREIHFPEAEGWRRLA